MGHRKFFKHFNFLVTAHALPELCGPLHAAPWALLHWLQKAGFVDHIWGPGPPESKFQIFDVAAISCTLAYIFCTCWQTISGHMTYKTLGRSTSKQPPKLGVQNFWGRGTFWVWPLWVISPILPVRIMGLSTWQIQFLFWGNRFLFGWDMGL